MAKVFNVTGNCRPGEHYMVRIDERLAEIKKWWMTGNILPSIGQDSMGKRLHCACWAGFFLRLFMRNKVLKGQELTEAIAYLKENAERKSEDFSLMELFEGLSDICSASDKPIVLMIDEVDSATNNQVFPGFLAQLRAYYIDRDVQQDKNQFIENGRLNMKRILEKFAVHFNDLYGSSKEQFIEEEGRKYFLLYLRPIINGSGNYYIEACTRSLGRTDVIVDLHGEQYVIEMKIWRGNEYNMRGEEQLTGYQDDYHKNKGYMVSFNFNKKKQIGVREIVIGEKTLIEAVV